MAVHHATARKLATQAEWTLLQSSYGRSRSALSVAQLHQKIARARTLRDKYRALAKQQQGEARGKRAPRSTRAAQGNANTKVKAAMFAEALARLQERASELKAAGKQARSTVRKAAPKKRAMKATTKSPKKATTRAAKKAGSKAPAKRAARDSEKKRPLAFAPPAEAAPPVNPWAAFAPPAELSLKAQSKASRGARKSSSSRIRARRRTWVTLGPGRDETRRSAIRDSPRRAPGRRATMPPHGGVGA